MYGCFLKMVIDFILQKKIIIVHFLIGTIMGICMGYIPLPINILECIGEHAPIAILDDVKMGDP